MKQKSVKWWRYFFLLCLMGISVCMYASGGKRTLNGLVTDVEGVPVIGANILVKGQTTGVILHNGFFSKRCVGHLIHRL